jgi:Cu-Zn family superoxide dismutase
MMKKTILSALLAASGLLLGGCHEMRDRSQAANPTASADLASTSGSHVTGKVSFHQEAGRMIIEADLQGLSPGRHGFHIHEFGDCGNNAKSAGGHFNPSGQKHGPGMLMDSHAGDLGNIVADADGRAHAVIETEHLSFKGETSVIGKSLVIHADPDDLVSQPAGNSGERIACGLIYQTGP